MHLKLITLAVAIGVTACKGKSAEPNPSNPPAAPAKTVAAPAPAPDQPMNKPPSTGKEMPVSTPAMTAEKARALVAEAVTAAKAGRCDDVVDTLTVAMPVAFPKPVPDAKPGFDALGKCATMTKHWRAAVQAGLQLLQLGDDDSKLPARIVRALAEMGEYDKALKAARDLAKANPKAEALLSAAMTFTYCRAEAWDACEKAAELSIAALRKSGVPETDASVQANRILRDLAWVVTGKPKEALADLVAAENGTPNPALAQIKQTAELAIARGFYLEVVPIPQLPMGVYHLMGRADTGALVSFKLREHAGEARSFRIETEVPGVTEKSSNTLALGKRAATTKWANPPLKMGFDPSIVRGPRPSQLAVKVIETSGGGERVIIDETIPIEVLPRDYLPLRRKVGADSMVPTFGYLGAWITSNDKAVDTFLTKAKERLPTRQFVGEQDVTTPQVQALFEELKARGVSYVMDPSVTGETTFVQRTRLPAEILASTNAQCLEGTLLFATLMEAIGIRPILVIVPGHAFVGWHTVPKDGVKGNALFVETTMVGGASFAEAVQVATTRVMQERADGAFESGSSTLIDVAAIRQAGFTAQPM